jgi:3-phenylpropionate/trans-cinnamate dioxygenase ferredoxin subunit
MTEKTFVAVAKVDDVPPGTKKLVDVNGIGILICHSADSFFAVRNLCSHADEPLDCGRMRGSWIACPIHGARFNLETGAAMNPPATTPIQTYPLRIVDDMIEVAT